MAATYDDGGSRAVMHVFWLGNSASQHLSGFTAKLFERVS